jgi:hypothetical protein
MRRGEMDQEEAAEAHKAMEAKRTRLEEQEGCVYECEVLDWIGLDWIGLDYRHIDIYLYYIRYIKF